jgi:hypothetical protein
MCSRTELASFAWEHGTLTARLLSLRETCLSQISLNFTRANDKMMMKARLSQVRTSPMSLRLMQRKARTRLATAELYLRRIKRSEPAQAHAQLTVI